MNISEAAEAAGLSPKMIRHYEQIGLVAAAARTERGYRQYSERDVSVLRFIRQARDLGFSMAQIAELIGLWSDRSRASRSVKALAERHVADLEQKMRELAAMKQALEQLVASCHGSDDPQCAILDGLAVHSPAAREPASPQAPGVPRLPAPRRRSPSGAATRPATRAQAPALAVTSHADLMAWTRQLRVAG
ncbi:MAG: Cu(I)-responsive transcriptional regulator [Rubrivivax sp.]|nr:Cu(I)-responsive transcriptional regulator [Rubrivivax sp.]